MAYKLRNREVFETTVDGQNYTFTCYTQDTSYGFRHICTYGRNNTTECRWVKKDIVAKSCYYNRTWESFRYETVLRNGIENVAINEHVEDELKAILIDKRNQREHEETEQFLASFEKTFNSLNQENKDHLKNVADALPGGMITSEEQAKGLDAIAKLMSVLQ